MITPKRKAKKKGIVRYHKIVKVKTKAKPESNSFDLSGGGDAIGRAWIKGKLGAV